MPKPDFQEQARWRRQADRRKRHEHVCLSRISKSRLGGEDKPIDVNAMNTWANLLADTPTFGAWCVDGNDVVFAQFFPNLMKGLPDFTDLIISWARRRLATAPELADLVRKLEEE